MLCAMKARTSTQRKHLSNSIFITHVCSFEAQYLVYFWFLREAAEFEKNERRTRFNFPTIVCLYFVSTVDCSAESQMLHKRGISSISLQLLGEQLSYGNVQIRRCNMKLKLIYHEQIYSVNVRKNCQQDTLHVSFNSL